MLGAESPRQAGPFRPNAKNCDETAPTIRTDRLHLRLWRDDDLPAFAALNADPRVMEFFPKPLDRAESDALAARIRDELCLAGFGHWAVEVPGSRRFHRLRWLVRPAIRGALHALRRDRLATRPRALGLGYASEAARAALDFGFRSLGLDQIVSFTCRPIGGRGGSWSESEWPERPTTISITRRFPRDTRYGVMSFTGSIGSNQARAEFSIFTVSRTSLWQCTQLRVSWM